MHFKLRVIVHSNFFFNYRKVPKEFHLDYDKLEDRPSLPTNLTGAQHAGGVPAAPTSAGSPAPPPMGPMAGLQQAQISPNMNSGPMPPPGAL